MSLAVAPARPLPPRRLTLRDEFAPAASAEEWADACREAFAELSGLEPLPWSTARCVQFLQRANRRLVEQFLKRSAFRLYGNDPRRVRNVGEASVASLVAAALGSRPECWGEFGEALVLVGHAAVIAGPQQLTLRRLAELGATVAIDMGAGWGRGDAYQIRIWGDREALPEATPAERLATRRLLGL